MKLTATMVGSLKADMQAELRHIAKSVPDGIKAAGDGLKGSLRKQVVAAGLGVRLSRTWRVRTYPNRGYNAASLVWSKAPQIIRAFDKGAVIKGRGGNWLAIPTPAAPKRGDRTASASRPPTFLTGRHGQAADGSPFRPFGAAGGRRCAGECEDRTGRKAAPRAAAATNPAASNRASPQSRCSCWCRR